MGNSSPSCSARPAAPAERLAVEEEEEALTGLGGARASKLSLLRTSLAVRGVRGRFVRGVRELVLLLDQPLWAGLGVTLTKSAKLKGWECVGVERSWKGMACWVGGVEGRKSVWVVGLPLMVAGVGELAR